MCNTYGQEIRKVEYKLVKAEVNIASSRENVVEVERTINMVKELGRVIINTLPYYLLPDNIIIHMV